MHIELFNKTHYKLITTNSLVGPSVLLHGIGNFHVRRFFVSHFLDIFWDLCRVILDLRCFHGYILYFSFSPSLS